MGIRRMSYWGHLFHRRALAKRKPGIMSERVSTRASCLLDLSHSQTPIPPITLFPNTDPGALGRDI